MAKYYYEFPEWAAGLSVRAKNVLVRTLEAGREAWSAEYYLAHPEERLHDLSAGEVRRYGEVRFLRGSHVGRVTVLEIGAALGGWEKC